eukprot:SAG22_NODE_2349_length_2681_cov_20.618900_3_plen_66_part_00
MIVTPKKGAKKKKKKGASAKPGGIEDAIFAQNPMKGKGGNKFTEAKKKKGGLQAEMLAMFEKRYG